MDQMTSEQAKEFYHSGKWKEMSEEQIAKEQINQRFLFVRWDVFHKAVTKLLGRPVFTHEFASDELKNEVNSK